MRSNQESRHPSTPIEFPIPEIDQSVTQFLTSAAAAAIARKGFERSAPMVAYAFWDPYKNNPTPAASDSMLAVNPFGGDRLLQVLGRIRVGNGASTAIEIPFDIPWGQLVAIPIVAEQVEITARIILAPDPAVDITSFLAWNDPPPLALPPGFFLPNRTQIREYPQGYVAVTGSVGRGSAVPNNSAPLTRSRAITVTAALSRATAIAYGARRFGVFGGPTVTGHVVQLVQGGLHSSPFIPNTMQDLPPGAVNITVDANAVVADQKSYLVYELGI